MLEDFDVLGAGSFIHSSRCASPVDGTPLAADIATHATPETNQPFVEAVPSLIKALIETFLSQASRTSTTRSVTHRESQGRKDHGLGGSEVFRDVEQSYDPEDSSTGVARFTEDLIDVLACTFYLRNKNDHRACLTSYQLRNIEDVREHLSIVHRRPNFCPVCGSTFSRIADRDSHIRGRTCHTQNIPPSIFEGLTISHIQELAQLAELPLSVESHWYEMWATIFSDAERPKSCYYSTAEEIEHLCYTKFWSRHRRSISDGYLESNGLQSNSVNYPSETLVALYNTVLNGAIDRFLGVDT